MKKILIYSSLWLVFLLLLQLSITTLNYNDELILYLLAGSIVLLLFTIFIYIPVCLFRRELRNICSARLIVTAIAFLALVTFITNNLVENVWQLEIVNYGKQATKLHICNIRSEYTLDITIPEQSNKFVYIPGDGIFTTRVRICIDGIGCASDAAVCRGWGGCFRIHNTTRIMDIVSDAKKYKGQYGCSNRVDEPNRVRHH